MKNLLFTATLVALFGFASANPSDISFDTPIPCEHCAKDHTCDEKCKKGDKSECCKKAKADSKETSDKAVPACCKKGKKDCKGKMEKKSGTDKNETKF